MATVATPEELDAATCSVCKDVYRNPVMISCEHTFCEDCINQTWSANCNEICPVCRSPSDGSKDTDFNMIQMMSTKTTACTKCGKNVILTEYRRHEATCGASSFTGSMRGLNAGASTSTGLGNMSGANIYTFTCPYCQNSNFGREDLRRHVLGQHKGENPKVVCPICKVMPWGNTQQISDNFLDHIKLRHQFDYDRFVDLNQDEEASLENTLTISLEQY